MASRKRGFIQPRYLSNPSPTNSSVDRRQSMILNRGAGRRAFTSCSWNLPDEQPLFKRSYIEDDYEESCGSGSWMNEQYDMDGGGYPGRNTYGSTERTDRRYDMDGGGYSGRNTYGSTERTDWQYDMDGGGYSGRNTYGSTERTDWQKSYIPDTYADQELFSSGNRMDEQGIEAPVGGPCTLYLRGMNKNTTKADITSHFQKYGTIIDVQCERNNIARSYLKGQVTFSDPFMAERAWLVKKHSISSVPVTVSRHSNFQDYYAKIFRKKLSLQLYVCGFDHTTPEEALYQYFAHFGEVYKVSIEDAVVEIHGKKKCFSSAVGRIYFRKLFVDFESLVSDDHYFEGNRLEVSYSPFAKADNTLHEILLKKKRIVVKEQTIESPLLKPASEVSLKSFNKTDGRCQTFDEDPHDVCVFCRALGLSTFTPCYGSRECEKCAGVKKSRRTILKKLWIAQSQDTKHPCYWNMSPYTMDLQPTENITADTFDCVLCLMTVGRSLQDVSSHLHSDQHKKNVESRVEVMRNRLGELYKHGLWAYRHLIRNNTPTKFCFVCFKSYSSISKMPHEKTTFHQLSTLLWNKSCDTCGVSYASLRSTHYWSQNHLTNTWHDMILNGDADISDKRPTHNLTGIIGADLIPHRRAGYCEACAGFFSTDEDGSLFAHCKTYEHFKNCKLFLQKKKAEAEVDMETE